MVEVVDDTVEQGQNNLMDGVVSAAAVGGGSLLLGPSVGTALGATVAGGYVGGTVGTALTVAGMAFGLAGLLAPPFSAGGMGGATSGNTRTVK